MEEKTMTINELMDRINEAQALAYRQHIKANAIIINENFVSVPSTLVGNAEYPPMICGLEAHYTRAELPDNAMFAVCEVMETKREQAIRLAKRDLCYKIKDYINDKIVENYGDDADSVNYFTFNIDEFFDKLDDLAHE